MRLLPCGDAALLAELDDLSEVLALRSAIDAERDGGGLADVLDVVPAARTVLVRCHPVVGGLSRVAERLAQLDVTHHTSDEGPQVEIEVYYDGPDLADVAELTGLSEDEVVRLHTEAEWTVAFTGFLPGFGYLVGGDKRLSVPRRDESRTKVPAGSVGLAGEFTGAYPRESPGGWQLIGRTEAPLWNPDREQPALLAPGTRVTFVRAAP
ncbi:MAG TPA: 5-oxoprolinase subunit PxpB [Nocardioides sp.]|jgi:KipI family sensor histidine kinase inhibitor|nr:5-oxoprolinase subunit PxpB [Nocardioides sp.]